MRPLFGQKSRGQPSGHAPAHPRVIRTKNSSRMENLMRVLILALVGLLLSCGSSEVDERRESHQFENAEVGNIWEYLLANEGTGGCKDSVYRKIELEKDQRRGQRRMLFFGITDSIIQYGPGIRCLNYTKIKAVDSVLYSKASELNLDSSSNLFWMGFFFPRNVIPDSMKVVAKDAGDSSRGNFIRSVVANGKNLKMAVIDYQTRNSYTRLIYKAYLENIGFHEFVYDYQGGNAQFQRTRYILVRFNGDKLLVE